MSDTTDDMDFYSGFFDFDDEYPLTWTMKDGTVIQIKDMKTSHIENCIKMLERNHHARIDRWLYAVPPNGEHAQDAFDQEMSMDVGSTVGEKFPVYHSLVDELERRKK